MCVQMTEYLYITMDIYFTCIHIFFVLVERNTMNEFFLSCRLNRHVQDMQSIKMYCVCT